MPPFKNQFNPDASKGEGGTEQWIQVQSKMTCYTYCYKNGSSYQRNDILRKNLIPLNLRNKKATQQ